MIVGVRLANPRPPTRNILRIFLIFSLSMIVGVRLASLRPPTITIIAQSRRFVILPLV